MAKNLVIVESPSKSKTIEKYGIINEHRKSYGPVKEYIEKNGL